MNLDERQKKLTYAEKQLTATRRRINRLMTAQRNWQKKVTYHSSMLQQEQAERLSQLSVGTAQGRKFR